MGAASAMGALLWAESAWAHGSGELEIFSYLLEEPGFLRLTAGILGVILFALGAFIAWQGERERRRMEAAPAMEAGPDRSAAPALAAAGPDHPEGEDVSRLLMIAPGAIFSLIGAVILLGALFILPDRVETNRHGHSAAGPDRSAGPDHSAQSDTPVKKSP
jgi:hypothetical protein